MLASPIWDFSVRIEINPPIRAHLRLAILELARLQLRTALGRDALRRGAFRARAGLAQNGEAGAAGVASAVAPSASAVRVARLPFSSRSRAIPASGVNTVAGSLRRAASFASAPSPRRAK
jgi:hypothetical protein